MQKFFLISLLLILFVGCDASTETKSEPKSESIRAVSGLGVAVGKYDIVDLTLSANSSSESQKWAHSNLKHTVSVLTWTLSKLKEDGVVFDDSERTATYDLSKVWDWKDALYEETKHMTMKERIKYLNKKGEEIEKKYNLNLRKADIPLKYTSN